MNFLLFQVEFLKLVAGGDHAAALKVASSHLGPIAASNKDLLKPLKETLVTLIQPNEDVLTKAVSLPVLASSLQVCFYVYICCKVIGPHFQYHLCTRVSPHDRSATVQGKLCCRLKFL